MSGHDAVKEQLAEYVAGVLDPAEAAVVAAHLERCADCRAEVAAIEDQLRWLPMAVTPVQPSPGFAARVLAVATGHDANARAVVPIRTRKSSRLVPWALAAATILCAGLAWQQHQQGDALRRDLADSTAIMVGLRSNAAAAADTLSVLRHASHVAYASLKDGKTPGGVVLLDDPTTHRWYMVAYGLPTLPAGQRYQLWFVGSDGMAMGKALAPSASGVAKLTTDMPVPAPGRILGAMVTIETSGAVPAAHGPPVATLML